MTQSDGSVLQVVASSRTECRPLPEPVATLAIVWEGWWCRNYACGHRGPRAFKVNVFGAVSRRIRQRARCPDCFLEHEAKRTAKCACCGLPIMHGDPVALYVPVPAMKYLAGASQVDGAVVGCLRWDCAPTGGFFAGHWIDGKVRSALENSK